MAFIQTRLTSSGEERYRVAARVDGRIRWQTFEDPAGAADFSELVDRIGGPAAIEVLKRRRGSKSGGTLPTVGQAIRHHIDKLGSGISDGTRKDYLRYASEMDALGPGLLPVDVYDHDADQEWVDTLINGGSSSKTVRNKHGLVFAAMQRQVDSGAIPGNPCYGVIIRDTGSPEMVILEQDEFLGTLDCMRPHCRPFFKLLGGTGLRLGEATALWPQVFNLKATPPRLQVVRAWKFIRSEPPVLGPPKTKRGRRTVALNEDLLPDIRPLVDSAARGELVFVNRRRSMIRQQSIHEIWTRALDDANDHGVHDKRPRIHDIRHSHVSWLLAQQVPMNVVQDRLGHESYKTTSDRYGHLLKNSLQVAAAASALAPSRDAVEQTDRAYTGTLQTAIAEFAAADGTTPAQVEEFVRRYLLPLINRPGITASDIIEGEVVDAELVDEGDD